MESQNKETVSHQQKNWFQRHKILTGIIGFFVFVSLVNGISTGGKGIDSKKTVAQDKNSVVNQANIPADKAPQNIPSNAAKTDTKPAIEAPVAPTPVSGSIESPIKITTTDLYNAYQNNAVSAEEKYQGKYLELKGTVNMIDKDLLGSKYVALKTTNMFNFIQCIIADSEKEKISGLNKGQTVTLQGKVRGQVLGNIILDVCKIE